MRVEVRRTPGSSSNSTRSRPLLVLVNFGSEQDIDQTVRGLTAEGFVLSAEDEQALTARLDAVKHPDGIQTVLPQD